MKKIISLALAATLFLGMSPVVAAPVAKETKPIVATKKTKNQPAVKKPAQPKAIAAAKGQQAPPPGYMELISEAHTAYLKASAKAKASKNKKALEAAEKAYSEAMEKALAMLGN